MVDESKIVSREVDAIDGWQRFTIAGQGIDPQNDWAVRITSYRKDGREVIIYQGAGRYMVSSGLGEEVFRYGTAMANGSAVNRYTKTNFGFRHTFRPQHPFRKTT